jgi:DNA-binding ferritin-like protein (Dps family)
MDNQALTIFSQSPILLIVGFAVWYVTTYIDKKHKDMNERYDKLNEEYKTEMKESNTKLIELTAKTVSALENNTLVFRDVLESQNRIEVKIDNVIK